MDHRNWKRKIRALNFSAAALLLLMVGCASDIIWVERENLQESMVLELHTCWNASDERGAEIKRLVESFNLRHYGEVSVQLVTVAGREAYIAHIRALAAANELPALFVLNDAPDNEDFFLSERLLPLAFDDGVLSIAAKGRLLPLGQSRIMLYSHKGFENDIGFDAASIIEHTSNSPNLFAVCAPYGDGPACDLLLALCQTAATGPDRDALRHSLSSWHAIMSRSISAGSQAYDRISVVQLWTSGDAEFLLEEEAALVPLRFAAHQASPLISPDGNALYGECWGVGASSGMTTEEQIAALEFLTYIEKERSTDIFSASEFGQSLYSRLMIAQQREMLSAILDRYMQDESTLEEAANYLANLPIWGTGA